MSSFQTNPNITISLAFKCFAPRFAITVSTKAMLRHLLTTCSEKLIDVICIKIRNMISYLT